MRATRAEVKVLHVRKGIQQNENTRHTNCEDVNNVALDVVCTRKRDGPATEQQQRHLQLVACRSMLSLHAMQESEVSKVGFRKSNMQDGQGLSPR